MLGIPEAWKFGLLAGLAVFILGAFGVLLVARANLKAELAEALARVAVCQSANEAWLAQNEMNKRAVEAMKAESEKRGKLVREAEARAAREVSARSAMIESLAHREGQGCADMDALLRDYREKSR